MSSLGGGAAALRSDARARRSRLRRASAVIITLRPRQWVKNLLVIAAAGAAGAFGHDDVPVRVSLAFVAFCLLSSAIYAINDVRDVQEDRRHPRKRFRPIAAGELDTNAAMALGAGLMLIGLGLCLAVSVPLAAVGLGYLVVTISYTALWRYLPLFDIAAIAAGFVLRAVAGGVAAPVALSRWFIVVISCAAVLIAAGKRQAELRRTTRAGIRGRRVLELYTEARLRLIMIGSAAGALFAYCVWAFQLPTVAGVPWRPLTVLPFAAGIARYGAMTRAGSGEAPEELLLTDRRLQLAAVVWLVLFALGVHAAA